QLDLGRGEAGTAQRLFAGARHALHRTFEDLLALELPAGHAIENAAIGVTATHALHPERLARVGVAAELLREQALLLVGRLQDDRGSAVAEQHRHVPVAP